MADAAQEFLDKKLSKNKYTIKQQETLAANGGPAVVNASDGVVPGGSAYSKYGEINAAEKNAASAAESAAPDGFYESGWRSSKDSGEIGWSDTWNDGGNFQQIKGDGKLNAAYDERFNTLTNQDNTDVDNHGAGWKNLSDMGTMGSTEQMKALAAEWEQAGYDVRIQDMEGHNGVSEANIAVRKGQEDKGERPEERKLAVQHSPEIEQAKERVKTYEDDIMSGKTSEDIYQTGSNGKYTFDGTQGASGIGSPTKGAAGIGTPMNGSSLEQADKATASFLDNKKAEVKNKYQFQAQG